MLTDGLAPIPRLAIIAGMVLLLVAVIWRAVEARVARKRLSRSLASPNRDVRCSAIAVATSQGLGRHARALRRLLEGEMDERVLDTLENAVARSLWEPADNQAIIELRLWAEERRREAPVAPLESDEPLERDEPELDGYEDELAPARTAPLPAARRTPTRATPARATRAPSADRISTVMVTGAGGPAGINVIRSLMSAGHRVIAVDADPLAAGLHLASAADVVVPADDPAFVDQVMDLVRAHEAEALVPTIAEEMAVLAERRTEVLDDVAAWLPNERALADSVDKWRFACTMTQAGIPIPETTLPEGTMVPGPWVVKPRRARGSRDVHYVDRTEDLSAAIRMTPDAIVQTRATGSEFTVDALVDREGEVVGAVPRWRLETKAGISTKGRTFNDPDVIDGVTSVLAALGLDGAANVQGFVDDGRITFLEVNPRFSGGLSLSLASGADLVGEYLRGVFGLPIRPERLVFTPDLTMVRHFEEIYL